MLLYEVFLSYVKDQSEVFFNDSKFKVKVIFSMQL